MNSKTVKLLIKAAIEIVKKLKVEIVRCLRSFRIVEKNFLLIEE